MRVFFFSMLWITSVVVKAQIKPFIDSSYSNSHYQNRLQMFQLLPKQKNTIVFLGNSITEAGSWQELVPGKPVVNRGISGDVTYGVLARLNEVLALKPFKIFLLIGVNDLKRGIPIDTVAFNYERIIIKIKQRYPRTVIYVQSILPVKESLLPASYQKLSNEKVKALNSKLRDIALTYKLTYVDLHEVFADEQGQLLTAMTIDGVHLKPAAYVEWVSYLKRIQCL